MRFRFDDLVAVMARLRSDQGCPWDRQQTHATLGRYLLEEAHEALEAIARDDPAALRQELGDLLLQVVFHGQLGREAGTFTADDVVDGLVRKLLARHPHVFGDLHLGTAREVEVQWEELKRREEPTRGPLDGIPATLPALARVQAMVERLARADDGRHLADPTAAAAALRAAVDAALAATHAPEAARTRALGDLLLAATRLAVALQVNAEAALRAAGERIAAG
ncbi:MAG: MazG family protein [Armatimonadota bacterium]|nr:MazG family protein [Armatimonadota bacterium]